MTQLPLRANLLFIKSIVLSILLHLLFFNLIIFTFPVLSNKNKPRLSFLGSLLKYKDISQVIMGTEKNIKKEIPPQILSRMINKDNIKPFDEARIIKPLMNDAPQNHNKIISKSTFAMPKINKSEIESENSQIKIDYKPTRYIPLKLSTE